MKKLYISAMLAVAMSSCQMVDVLDQKPEYQADLDGAITTPKAVELALNGVYKYLPGGGGLESTYITCGGAFKAGTMIRAKIVTSGNAVYYSERYYPELNFSDDGVNWTNSYNIIKNANYLETALDRMNDSDFNGNRRQEIYGEIAYLRAFAYFRILSHYGQYWDLNSEYGVILRTEAPAVNNALKARSTVAESYKYIFEQLETAIAKAPERSTLSQANKSAAKLLKARAYLYSGQYAEAINAVNDLVDTDAPLAESSFANIFDNFNSSKEILFARVFDSNEAKNMSTRLSAFGNSPNMNQGYWGPTDEYVELVGNDPRANAIFSPVDSLKASRGNEIARDLKSIRKLLNEANNSPIIYDRMSEAYLIKAEAIFRNGGSIAEAYAPIAQLRNRAGAPVSTPATREELEDAIFIEWFIEMAFENEHEWYTTLRFAGFTDRPDFSRLFQYNTTLKEKYDDEVNASDAQGEKYYQRIIDRRIYGIPSSEYTTNHECIQNPGYTL